MTYTDEYFTMLEIIAHKYKVPPTELRRKLNSLSRHLGEDPLYIGAIIANFVSEVKQEKKEEPYAPSFLAVELIEKIQKEIKVSYGTDGANVRVDPFLVTANHQQLFDAIDSIVNQMKINILTFRCGKCRMVHQLGFDVAMNLELPAEEAKICAFCELEEDGYMLSEIPSCYEEAKRILELKDSMVKVIMVMPEGAKYQIICEKHRPERFKLRIHSYFADSLDALTRAGFDLEKEKSGLVIIKII